MISASSPSRLFHSGGSGPQKRPWGTANTAPEWLKPPGGRLRCSFHAWWASCRHARASRHLRAGYPHTRYKEWLLEIDFHKRETFAYACEVYARILEQARKPAERVAMVEEFAEGPMLSEEHLDPPELVDILREAAGARNGWKRILGRCAPPPRKTFAQVVEETKRRMREQG